MVGSVLLGLLIWNEILGPVHIFGIALIVGARWCETSSPATEEGTSKRLIHQSSWKDAFSEVRIQHSAWVAQ
jgi:hypothetical protein